MIKTARKIQQFRCNTMSGSLSTPALSPSHPCGTSLLSLQQRRAAALFSICHHPRQLFAAEGKRVSTDFARSKERLSTPSPRFLSPPFRTRDQRTAPAMTIAPTVMHPGLRCECVPEGLCERLRDVFASVVCTCVCARECVYVCITLCVARAIELCSNYAKLRISVSDELRDLQYNCATSPPSSPLRSYLRLFPPVYAAVAERITASFEIYAPRMYGMEVYICTNVHNKHDSTTPRNIGILYPGTRYLRKRIAR